MAQEPARPVQQGRTVLRVRTSAPIVLSASQAARAPLLVLSVAQDSIIPKRVVCANFAMLEKSPTLQEMVATPVQKGNTAQRPPKVTAFPAGMASMWLPASTPLQRTARIVHTTSTPRPRLLQDVMVSIGQQPPLPCMCCPIW